MPVGDERASPAAGHPEPLEALKFTSEEVGQLLEDLQPYADQLDPDSNDARLIRVATRRYKKKTRVPAEWVARKAEAAGEGYRAWEEARATNNFSYFRPYLERNVELRQEYAEYFKPYEHIYDPLLDEFEPGIKTGDVQRIFEDLRPKQVALIQAIGNQPQVEDAFLHQQYDQKKQWDFGAEVVTKFGYDWARPPGRSPTPVHAVPWIGRCAHHHPLPARFPSFRYVQHDARKRACHLRPGDRPSTRPHLSGRWGLVGDPRIAVPPIYENLLGRSYDFWTHFYPKHELLSRSAGKRFLGQFLQRYQ
jgi:carboxypeptidase Taq